MSERPEAQFERAHTEDKRSAQTAANRLSEGLWVGTPGSPNLTPGGGPKPDDHDGIRFDPKSPDRTPGGGPKPDVRDGIRFDPKSPDKTPGGGPKPDVRDGIRFDPKSPDRTPGGGPKPLAFSGMDETVDQYKERMSHRPQVLEQHKKQLVDIDALFENPAPIPEVQVKQGQALDFVRRNGVTTDYDVQLESNAAKLVTNHYPNGIGWSAREEFPGLDIKKEFIAQTGTGHGTIDVSRLNPETNKFDSRKVDIDIIK